MDARENALPDTINPNIFPAKLWHLVNDPTIKAIYWDSRGEVIVIDQKLFEERILSPRRDTSNENFFKTTNFSSFVRQLNLYGFRKGDLDAHDEMTGSSGRLQYFYNPNFQRNQPGLLAHLRRLTVNNKAKLKAGLEVSCRLQNRCQRHYGGGDIRDLKRNMSFLTPPHQGSPHPSHPNKIQVVKEYSGTPVPCRQPMRGHGLPSPLSPSIFPAVKEMPGSSSQYYPGAATSSNAMHIQQGLLTHPSKGNPNVTSYNPQNTPYQPCYYPTVCRCCHSSVMLPPVIDLQKGLYSPQSYYQGAYPVNLFDLNQELQHKENQEAKKRDLNLDTIFQIADEVMQTSSNTYPVKVETPEKQVPVFGVASNTSNTAGCKNSGGSTKPVKVLSGCHVATQAQKAEPEQMPEDAIHESGSNMAEQKSGEGGCIKSLSEVAVKRRMRQKEGIKPEFCVDYFMVGETKEPERKCDRENIYIKYRRIGTSALVAKALLHRSHGAHWKGRDFSSP